MYKISYDGLKKQNLFIKKDLNKEFNFIMDYSYKKEDKYIKKFEKDFAKFCETRYCVGTANGTSAIQFALIALGIQRGDEIITVPNSFIATALAISNIDAKPVFVDVDEDTYNIDVEKIEDAITERTKAIIPVHLYGQMADMKPIQKIAKNYGLKIIEDAAQAHGAKYNGKKAGSLSDVGCFSFHHSKNLSGFGNGGAIVTNKKDIFRKIKILRNPTADDELVIHSKRTPSYLDTIQIAFLNSKMKYFKEWNDKKRKIAECYYENLNKKKIKLPKEAKNCRHTFRDFCILIKKRSLLKYYLLTRGIETRIHYHQPIHLAKPFKHLSYDIGSFPISESICKNVLSLPIHPFLIKKEVKYIINKVNKFCKILN